MTKEPAVNTNAVARLLRVLDLEERQGWRNRAVIGGLQAMAARWGEDARAEKLAEAMVKSALSLMEQYGRSQAGRGEVVAQLRRVLAGESTSEPGAGGETGKAAVGGGEGSPLAAQPAPVRRPERVVKVGDDELPDDVQLGSVYVFDYKESGAAAASSTTSAPQTAQPGRAKPAAQARSSRNPRDLQSSPSILTGVGPATVEQLERLGISRVVDLLWHLPVRHEDYSQMRTIAEVQPGEQVTIVANLWDVKERKLGFNRQMVMGVLADGTGTLHATWWNKFVAKQLTTGSTLRFSGKISLYMGQKTLDNPTFEDADADMIATGRLAPIYRLTEGLTHKRLRGLVRQVLEEYAPTLSDPLPRFILERYRLVDLTSALWQIHFPDNADKLAAATRRLAFEELFYLQLGVMQRRSELKQTNAPALANADELLPVYTNSLPFALTGAQQRVLAETAADLAASTPMTRLVQGDVGSGKTAVAAGAMWLAAANGLQSALLAPTQILAEQHHRGISNLLGQLSRPDGTPLTVELLTGRVTGDQRANVLEGLQSGAIDVVIGTTALIQEGVEFSNLGFVVVDEQHRFGVEQRGVLRSRNSMQPHMLVMSATPIPRSLALTLYGDLDVSTIDEMPPGRMSIDTRWIRQRQRERLYNSVRNEVSKGRQVYMVYPLVEESDKLDVGAAVEAHGRLQADVFPDLRLGLLHGRMSGSEKDEVMRAFAGHAYDILVSTTVIEVGIDVPNASVIIIEDAERFGLAQLHQLRGRVGRGQYQSYCVLVSDAEGSAAQERLRILEQVQDGFVLAEKDLELRGPGDFLGTRQSGLPDLRVAQMSDIETIKLAREAAQAYFVEDPQLARYPQLAKQVQRFWRGHGDIN